MNHEPPKASLKNRNFFLFTHVRTASNLLTRILNLDSQPTLLPNAQRDYYFVPATSLKFAQLDGKYLDEWSVEQRNLAAETFQNCFDALDANACAAADHGKNVFVKEHALWLMDPIAELQVARGIKNMNRAEPEATWLVHAPDYGRTKTMLNETVLPDEYLRIWLPTFLIRHPALVFPSLYRTGLDLGGAEEARNDPRHVVEMTFHWLRTLYDWYQVNGDWSGEQNVEVRWPIILDADDVINNRQVVCKYAEVIGLDPTKLKFEWESATDEDVNKMNFVERRMRSTLSNSTGIVESKALADVDIDAEAEKWRAEFGDEEAAKLLRWVCAAMPDFEYLKDRKFKVLA